MEIDIAEWRCYSKHVALRNEVGCPSIAIILERQRIGAGFFFWSIIVK